MKRYKSTDDIPTRYAFASRPALASGPYRAHKSYAAALNLAARRASTMLRRSGESKVFTVMP